MTEVKVQETGSMNVIQKANGNHEDPEETVDFSGKGLKLDTEQDAKPIVDAIRASKRLVCLKLEGNTLGVEAAKAIAKALESQPSFERALWKDAFTGRLKDEIPKALNFLGGGLILAQAHLAELDLSDNALGPIGMEGLVQFLKSPVCYSLRTLRLNNNGLGIYGGRMLARALLDCLAASQEAGSRLSLKTFIVGRNRLENEGALALSEFFKAVGTLEEVQMPQNFIRHPGITALAEAFVQNPGLRILNLNDNTFTWRGSQAVAAVLPELQQLSIINFGDCLVRTRGAEYLAKALSGGHAKLQEVYMDHGEINLSAAKLLVNALKNKPLLKILDLNGNQFGEDGCDEIRNLLKDLGRQDALQSLSDDEGEPESEEEEEEEEAEEEEAEEEEEEGEGQRVKMEKETRQAAKSEDVEQVDQLNFGLAQLKAGGESVTVADFLKGPTLARLNALGANRTESIVQYLKESARSEDAMFEPHAEMLMKLCSTVNGKSDGAAREMVRGCADAVLKEMFGKAQTAQESARLDNTLLVYMGLIKSEDKSFKLSWPLSGVLSVLEEAVYQPYMARHTLDTLQIFFSKPHAALDKYPEETRRFKQALFKI